MEDGSKKISKESKKIVNAVNAQSRSCGKIGNDLVNDLGDNASDSLKEFELAMNKQAMLAADKVGTHSLLTGLYVLAIQQNSSNSLLFCWSG